MMWKYLEEPKHKIWQRPYRFPTACFPFVLICLKVAATTTTTTNVNYNGNGNKNKLSNYLTLFTVVAFSCPVLVLVLVLCNLWIAELYFSIKFQVEQLRRTSPLPHCLLQLHPLDELTRSAGPGRQQDIARVLASIVKCKQRPLKSFRFSFCPSYRIFLPLF